jgi:outer membrane lipoprotein-sorting protein
MVSRPDLALSGATRHHGGVSIFDRRPGLRWAVPAAAGALIVTGTLVGSVAASADSGLPPRTAEELLVALQSPSATSIAGTVVSTADLGLPQLPTNGPSGTDLTSLVSGSHTLRLWSDGDQHARLALLGPAQEVDIVSSGRDVWLWSSTDRTVEHFVRPDESAAMAVPTESGIALPSTPQEAAAQVLAAVDPTTEVTTTGAGTVAGRSVYELVLTPRQAGTLVARVAIAVDAETSVPLRVQVYSRQSPDPAFEVGFTSVDFGPVDPAVFAFEPPPGATVTDHAAAEMESRDGDAKPADAAKPTIVGTGWEQVVVATLPTPTSGGDDAASGSDDAASGSDGAASGGDGALAMLAALPVTSGPWGTGRVLSGTLFSVILTDDGRIAVGAVPQEALGAALAAS